MRTKRRTNSAAEWRLCVQVVSDGGGERTHHSRHSTPSDIGPPTGSGWQLCIYRTRARLHSTEN
ncbi:hypothetical protein J6590_036211 [Homalodisca vitripennis]|nr:hypothetical protein J6590_036211 [Homalodisca vitripennis]